MEDAERDTGELLPVENSGLHGPIACFDIMQHHMFKDTSMVAIHCTFFHSAAAEAK